MEVATLGSIGKALAEFGILGLGWGLFIMMLFREVRERARYGDLVIHIIAYFTKVNMVERQTDDVPPSIPPELFNIKGSRRRRKPIPRRDTGAHDDGVEGG